MNGVVCLDVQLQTKYFGSLMSSLEACFSLPTQGKVLMASQTHGY